MSEVRKLSSAQLWLLEVSAAGGAHPMIIGGAGNFRTARSLVDLELGEMTEQTFTVNEAGIAALAGVESRKRAMSSMAFKATLKEIGPEGRTPAIALEPRFENRPPFPRGLIIHLRDNATFADAERLARVLDDLGASIEMID